MLKQIRLAVVLGVAVAMGIAALLPDAVCGEVKSLEQQRRDIVVKSMDFSSDQQKDSFLKVYEPYQKRLTKLAEERAVLIEAYSESQKVAALKTETARELLAQALALDRDRVRLVADYVAQLEKILPVQKVVRAYQIENRLQAVVAVNAAKHIPLAE
jgi:hypothetical protein